MTNLKQKRFVDTDYLKEQLDSTAIEVEGSYITATETKIGAIQDLEILGNTVQDPNNLADIKSVGELQEDGTYKMSISSCGKNLITGELKHSVTDVVYCENVFLNKNVKYTITPKNVDIVNSHIAISKKTNHEDPLQRISDFTENIRTFSLNDTLESGYYNLVFWKAGISNTENGFIQLEEGTIATPYEPYQGNKCDILLPCQLEKVGDVSDRLYYDDMEKAWCIEKNVETVVLEGNENWTVPTSQFSEDTVLGYTPLSDSKPSRDAICSTLPKRPYETDIWGNTINFECTFVNYAKNLLIRINKTKLITQDLSGVRQWLQANPTIIKYQLATPQKIVLPLSTQIALNSFFGTTHVYMESGEVEGIIKCKIPKSIGATVQSLNNKTDILSDRIEAIEGLKDSQNMKYETDKGYLVCKETKNGTIDDMKIEGKTLVNLVNNLTSMGRGYTYDTLTKILKGTSNGIDDSSWNGGVPSIFNIKADTEYTLVFNGITSNTILAVRSYDEIEDVTVNPCVIGLNVIKFTSSGTNFKLKIYDVNRSTQVSISHLMLLEGDHTQNPPSYFEGLMSVGQDVDKIEVLSSKNEFNSSYLQEIGKAYLYNNGSLILNSQYNSKHIEVKQNCYYLSFELNGGIDIHVTYWNDTNYIKGELVKNNKMLTLPRQCTKIIITYDTRITNILLYNDENKKQILFYNENGELEPIQELHEWDSIEKHSDNKWYYHKRSGKVVLDGSENWSMLNVTPNVRCWTTFRKATIPSTLNIFNDFTSIKNTTPNQGNNHLGIDANGNVVLGVDTTKATDLSSFKAWLQANNVTVVYQLAQEEVYECIDLGVNSYEGETLVQVNSGVICPQNLAFSTQKHIGNIVNKLQERVDKNTKFREELTENMTYTETIEQGKGYTVIENSKEGVVTVPEIKGKTLVNLSNSVNVTRSYNQTIPYETISNIQIGKLYTLIVKVDKNTCDSPLRFSSFEFCGGVNGVKLKDAVNGDYAFCPANTTGVFSLKVGVEAYGENGKGTRLVIFNSGATVGEYTVSCLLLEGDHTQNPPSFFEGLKSVGQGTDEIVVSSCYNVADISTEGDTNFEVAHIKRGITYSMSVKRSKSYGYNLNIRFNNGKEKRLVGGSYRDFNTFVSDVDGILYFNSYDVMNVNEIMLLPSLYTKETMPRYKPYAPDKKRLLYYNNETQTWEKPVLREWDSIEKHLDGKYYYHQRSAEVVLNGSENWNRGIELTNTTKYETLDFNNKIKPHNSMNDIHPLYCDKFIVTSDYINNNIDCESIGQTVSPHNTISIRISNTKLSSNNVEGFKQWLQANNMTVVYQLAQEEVYECINLDLNSYDGETNVIVESGAIVPQTTVKIQNNLQEIIRNLKNRVRQLEEEIYNYKVNQNLRQLRTSYRSDYANFGVATLNNYSVEPTSIAITPYGYDLFEIFKEVIAQGKDKYDRIELEEYIDFYLMTFVFDFDMVFELFDLLDANENIIEDEPVEEEPPTEEEEDVVEDTPTILPNLPEDEATPIPLI